MTMKLNTVLIMHAFVTKIINKDNDVELSKNLNWKY